MPDRPFNYRWWRHMSPALARAAADRWGGDDVRHVADSGNSVWEFRQAGERRILRLTHPHHRTRAQNEAELAFLAHLHARGVPVNTAVPSTEGAWIEEIPFPEGVLWASALTWIEGDHVAPDSSHWNEAMFREWGRTLGAIHEAAREFDAGGRWHWAEERWLADALTLIPEEDPVSRAEYVRIMDHLTALPELDGHFGMIHADYGPQNFRYMEGRGIGSFDFGNCCRHFFVADVAISLSVLRLRPEREQLRGWILAGYREERALHEDLLGEMDWFLRLRILYAYLSRLDVFGPDPTPDQQRILAGMRSAVHDRFSW